jgi:xanthine dehydrogenase iron-sulfur cluster and FAD-binding subunit A
MNHLTRTHSVIYIDGIKVMRNFKHNETIVILPAAMNSTDFVKWLELHQVELREFCQQQPRRP